MNGLVTALTAGLWLVGLLVLLRYPIVSIGAGAALVAWTWDPGGFWLALAVTAVGSLVRREFGPPERFLVRYPELAVALVAGVVALLAGGQVSAGALAVLVLALGWFVRTTVIEPTTRPAATPAATSSPRTPRSPAPVTGFLGEGALRVDAGPCPTCGGLLIATGHTRHDPARGPVFVAEARCTACGQHLVGVGDSGEGSVAWIDPDERWEGAAS